jgi:arylsulfatase A-like enzyme
MNRRHFLHLTSLAAGSLLLDCKSWTKKKQPNILFLFADDQTFTALHAFGNNEIHTPNLDRLTARSVRFTHAYNMGSWSGAVCIPSRMMLNTGRFLWSCKNAPAEQFPKGMLWSQRLKTSGYKTYMTGKWHVYYDEDLKKEVEPADVFDVVGTLRPGMPNQTPEGYNRPQDKNDKTWLPWDKSRGGYWKGGKHWSEVLGDETIDFLDQASKEGKPFFIYSAFNSPHDPRQSPREFVEMYPVESISTPENFLPEYPFKDEIGCPKTLRDEALAPFPRSEYAVKVNRQEYYAIITHMDKQIGRILDRIQESGQEDNTYIFFTADHGLACGQHGLLGKQNMYDHSVRVPFLVSGPGIEGGTQCSVPIYLQDIMPTTLEIAGAEREGVDFKNLMPLIKREYKGEKEKHYKAIYGAYKNLQRMITKDGFKLLHYPEAEVYRLFNLNKDPYEMNDLAERTEYAPKLKELKTALLELQKEMSDPMVSHSSRSSSTGFL